MKETKELLLALAMVGKLVVDRVKDGVDLSDAAAVAQALLVDGELKAAVELAIKDIDKIDDELKDFSVAKGLELAQVIPQLIEVLQKKA
jgi:hypothetical protein